MVRASTQNIYRLANQILSIVREAGFEEGEHLRGQFLADMLGVSRTPVRHALDLLAEQGIVEARKNHGFILLKPSNAIEEEVEVPATADETLYEDLVHDRLAGKLPNTLTQSGIAERYGVERKVVLAALGRMTQDGLIERNKGLGWSFLPTLETDFALRSSYDLRSTVEPAQFLLDTFRADPVLLDRMREQHLHLLAQSRRSALDRATLFETDAAFHEAFARFSGNAFFLQIVQQQNRLRRLLEFNSYRKKPRILEWCREHLEIIEAVKEGKLEHAARVMKDHLARAYRAAGSIRLADRA